jgi:hypothetical protein
MSKNHAVLIAFENFREDGQAQVGQLEPFHARNMMQSLLCIRQELQQRRLRTSEIAVRRAIIAVARELGCDVPLSNGEIIFTDSIEY